MTSPRKPLRTRRGGGRVVWGGDACVAHTHLRIDRTTQDWCKPLHRLDGPIRRIVGASPCGQSISNKRRWVQVVLLSHYFNKVLKAFIRPERCRRGDLTRLWVVLFVDFL